MNLTEFLKKEKKDSNLFWRLSSGEHQNLLDSAIEQNEKIKHLLKNIRQWDITNYKKYNYFLLPQNLREEINNIIEPNK